MTAQTIHRDERPDEKGRAHLTQIFAEQKSDGSLAIHGFHAGEAVEDWVGADDYRFGLTIRQDDLARALVALLADRFKATEPLRYTGLRALLKAEELEIDAGSL